MTATITKMEIRLSDLRPKEQVSDTFVGDIEKRSMANYILFRFAVRTLTGLAGAFLATSIRIEYVYLI